MNFEYFLFFKNFISMSFLNKVFFLFYFYYYFGKKSFEFFFRLRLRCKNRAFQQLRQLKKKKTYQKSLQFGFQEI